jgi:cysteine-S-conjugate beta-lyase
MTSLPPLVGMICGTSRRLDPAMSLPVPSLDALRRRQSAKWRMHEADVLPLSIAEMDFELAVPVADALRQAVADSDTGYAGSAPELAEAYAGFAAAAWDWTIDPTQVTAVTDVGVGAVELLRSLAPRRVIVSSPVYPPFFDWVAETRTPLVDVPLRLDAGRWRLDLDRIAGTLSAADVYLLCNPHNPVGTVHSGSELRVLVDAAVTSGAIILSDEIHAPLALPGSRVTPILTVPGASDVAYGLVSASKAWNLAGLKCAMVVTGSAATAARAAELPPDTRWRVGHFGILAATAAFSAGRPWLAELAATLGQRRTWLQEALARSLPGLPWIPPQAGYLAWLDCSGIGSGLAVTDLLRTRARVAVEAGERFGAGGAAHIRINFATSEEILSLGLDRIADVLKA